ncbi:unnamed protein product [Parajaminaea phylloscopi]
MKFGKQLQSNQIPGWSAAYLDYKFLKKIINSLEKGRLGDAALFATGVRPEYVPDVAEEVTAASAAGDGNAQASVHLADQTAQILPKVEPATELQAHKAAFFFKLERELEKINAFYLQKEAELKVRLKTLVDKRKLLMAKRGGANISKDSPAFYALYEGFRYFEKDLSKLQQFIEINATGFRKILKKWDKRSKSQTKELYLARQVEVQPCFNREFIAELSDIAAANLLELENLSERRLTLNGHAASAADGASALSPEKRLDFAAARSQEVDALADLEENLSSAIQAARTHVAADMIRVAQQNEDHTSVSRIVWRALLHAPLEAVQVAMDQGLPDYDFVDDINSRTSLHEAALAGNILLVAAAVQHGVDAGKRDIYGRAPISYAAMNGHADVCTLLLGQPGVDAATADLDGFSPLVLAVINGRSSVVRILLSHGVSVDAKTSTDLIPLCLAAQGGHVDITSMLLQRGAKVTSNPEGLTPQALAAREGHVDCLRLLLQAKADPDAPEKGTLWTPLFFAAENGHVDCVRALLESGCKVGALDEKGRNSTFYAAWKGHIDALLVLLEAESRVSASKSKVSGDVADVAMSAVDAAGSPANGSRPPHKKSRSNDQLPDPDFDLEIDGIPSLSLPPPIIPFRTYGHNYLDKRALVTISLSNSSVKLYKHQDSLGLDQFSTSSVKLVMTSRPDASATYIPHNIVLPLVDEREVFSFQVDALEQLAIEWELKPTFGSKVIGKAVALPSSFEGMTDRKKYVLPLQDAYLKVVGEVTFEIDFVKPFDGVQLEIGGRVETYWKSLLPGTITSGGVRMTPTGAGGEPTSLTSPPPASSSNGHNARSAIHGPPSKTSLSGSLAHSHREQSSESHTGGAGVGAGAGGSDQTAIPTAASITSIGGNTSALVPSAASASVVTASSLTGEYIRATVQVTRDGVAVVYPTFTLPIDSFDIYIGSLTRSQFVGYAKSSQRVLNVDAETGAEMSQKEWTQVLKEKMVTLEDLLSVLPPHFGLDIDILYPSSADVRMNPRLPKMEVNQFVDTILHAVYRAGAHLHRTQSRKILFTSRSPTVCTALNWKQPNYAVFFASDCGLRRDFKTDQVALAPSERNEPDFRRASVSEAVRFAKNNNLLGLAIDATLLNAVPELVQTIKAAGFLLITIGRFEASTGATSLRPPLPSQSQSQPQGAVEAEDATHVDGVIDDGLLVCRSPKAKDTAVFA